MLLMLQLGSFGFLALAAGVACGSIPVAVIAMPVVLSILAFLARVSLGGVPVTVLTPPIVFPVLTFLTGISLGDIEIAVEAPPVVLPVLALARVPFGVIEVTVVAPPRVFSVAAFAGIALRGVPPIGRVVASAASLHVVAGGVTVVAGGAGPIVLSVLAGSARVALLHSLLAVLAIPLHQYVSWAINIFAFIKEFRVHQNIYTLKYKFSTFRNSSQNDYNSLFFLQNMKKQSIDIIHEKCAPQKGVQ